MWETASVIVSPQSRDVQQGRMEKFGHAFMKGYQILPQWEKSFNGKNVPPALQMLLIYLQGSKPSFHYQFLLEESQLKKRHLSVERASSSYFSNRRQKGRKTMATVQSLSGFSSPSAQDMQSMCVLVLAVFLLCLQ